METRKGQKQRDNTLTVIGAFTKFYYFLNAAHWGCTAILARVSSASYTQKDDLKARLTFCILNASQQFWITDDLANATWQKAVDPVTCFKDHSENINLQFVSYVRYSVMEALCIVLAKTITVHYAKLWGSASYRDILFCTTADGCDNISPKLIWKEKKNCVRCYRKKAD